jgi:Activator of Hsp90 ATPase homolog 1-like protein
VATTLPPLRERLFPSATTLAGLPERLSPVATALRGLPERLSPVATTLPGLREPLSPFPRRRRSRGQLPTGDERPLRRLGRHARGQRWVDERSEAGRETLVTVTFEDLAGRTRVTLRQGPFPSAHDRDAHERGWRVCFERMAAYLASAVSDAVA